jgi:hypothetical protein
MPKPGEVKNRFTERLTGNSSSVDAHATNHIVPFHDSDALAQLCCRDCALLPGGPAADHNEVVSQSLRHSSFVRFKSDIR